MSEHDALLHTLIEQGREQWNLACGLPQIGELFGGEPIESYSITFFDEFGQRVTMEFPAK